MATDLGDFFQGFDGSISSATIEIDTNGRNNPEEFIAGIRTRVPPGYFVRDVLTSKQYPGIYYLEVERRS
jgi:hypothetical protein